MARRSARIGVQKNTDHSPSSKSSLDTHSNNLHPEASYEDEDICPACTAETAKDAQGNKENWIQCEACSKWFHWRCAGNGENMELVNKWYVHRALKTDV
jgi:F-box and leucine-rich repeat protein 10/11